MKKRKLLGKIIQNQKNIHFSDFESLIFSFGFKKSRIEGSHHIFTNENIPELVNIQNVHGKAKPYQIKQFLSLIEKYNLILEEEK